MPLPFSTRPEKTFLVEAGETRFRVDLRRLAGGYGVVRVLHNEVAARGGGAPEGLPAFSPGGGRVPVDTAWVAALLKRRPRPAREIVVLSDRVAAVVSEMPGGGEDWSHAAEMEARTVSGLSSAESVSAAVRLPSEAGIVKGWVVQTALRDVAALRSAVAACGGCRLVSVGHPAGVRLDRAAAQLECWSEFALFHAAGIDRLDLRGWNGPDAFAEALEDGEVASALAGGGGEGVRLLLGVPGGTPPGAEAAMAVDLADPAATEIWSARLAEACDPLTGRLLGMPLLNVPKPPPSTAALTGVAAGVAVLALLLAGGNYLLVKRERSRLEADLARLKAPAEKLASSNQRIADLRKQLAEFEKEEKGAKDTKGAPEVDVFAHRKRIGSVLEGIAAGAGVGDAVVLDLAPDGLDTVVSGAATTFNAPQTLASRIDETLASSGWRAALVRRTAKLLRPDGGPWSYEIRLTPGRPVAAEADRKETGDTGGNATGHKTGDKTGGAEPPRLPGAPVSASIPF